MRLFSRKVCRLLAILCIAALVLTACGDRTETTETEQETSSEEDLQARIQALEQKGIIEEYTTIINPQKISGAVSCYFEIETLPETFGQVAEILKENETVTQIYRVTGNNRLHVHAVAASGEELEAFIRDVIDPLPGVKSSSCNMILSRVKDIKGLRL